MRLGARFRRATGATKGAIASVLLSFPAAALVGLLWRFPFPLGGYTTGPNALWVAPIATLFYMLFGGIIAVPVLGGLAGSLATRVARKRAGARGEESRESRAVLAASALIALLFALFLAGLELIIGPW